MKTLTSLSVPRLALAIQRGGLTDGKLSIGALCHLLERRGVPDREIHELFFRMIKVIEPPPCTMSHCKHFGGVGAAMNCGLERVPGRCPILKQYKLRKSKKTQGGEVAV